ncbi:MAG: DNA polymerase I [Candidatus Kapaibacterium sp.]|nr:MAG: DNA polymerase I [Candidatus Kapabacteria bacterium]
MKFLILDAMSLIFRAFHAMSKMGLQAPNGELTGAVFGFANILSTLLNKEKPDFICIAFDTASPTFRHEMFDKYKAHRPEFPPELAPQLARIKQMITLLNITQIELAGYEADDIVGTLTKRFAGDKTDANLDIYCVTSDKDYCQLVNDHVKLLRPGFSMGEYDVMDIEGVHKKFGVAPEQVIELLALIGDSSDNVPGVKGIGEKTATPLIQEFGSVENVYANLANISKEAVRKKLEADRDMAMLSRELVTIHTDVPIETALTDFARREPNTDELRTFFLDLGFRSMLPKFVKESVEQRVSAGVSGNEAIAAPIAQTALKTLRDVPHEYITADTEEKVAAMVQELQSASLLAFDTETTSLDTMSCDLVGISLCGTVGRAFYVPMSAFALPQTAQNGISLTLEESSEDNRMSEVVNTGAQASMFDQAPSNQVPSTKQPSNQAPSNLQPSALIPHPLKAFLESPTVPKCGQNAKFDLLVLKRFGVNVAPVSFDTMLASYVLNPATQHGMDALAERWLQYRPIPISSLIGEKKKEQRSMAEVELERIAEYAAEDADVTLRLAEALAPQLERENLRGFADTVEFPLVEVLTTMESNGIAIDTGALGSISAMIRTQTEGLKAAIWLAAGVEFNVDSPKQLGDILFDKMKIPAVKKTKTGYSTDSSVLEELAAEHPIAELMLEYRQLTKLQSTYVEALPRAVNPVTKRIHTTYNQTTTNTGRLSSVEPNLQNIPIRTELGMEIRKAFIASRPDTVLLSADYSQIELRIMAHICGDETLTSAFQQGLDVHAATASVLFGVDVKSVDKHQRRIAKTVNFGVMYGQGAFGLAQQLKIPRGEGKTIIDNYFAKYPRIREYIDQTIASVREKGFATTLAGRRCYFPDITSANRVARTAAERAAINMPIQGAAADMMKRAMIAVHAEMKRLGVRSRMLLQIHDELVFEVEQDEKDALMPLVKRCMEGALELGSVPVVVEMGTGRNWAEAH